MVRGESPHSGRFPPKVGLNAEAIDQLLLDATRDYLLPIAANFDFGHTDPMFVLPWGLRAAVDMQEQARLTFLEAAVE